MDFQSFSKMASTLGRKKKKDDPSPSKPPQSIASNTIINSTISNSQNPSSDSSKVINDSNIPFEIISSTASPVHTALLTLKPRAVKLKDEKQGSSSSSAIVNGASGFIEEKDSKGLLIRWYRLMKNGKYVDIYPDESSNQKSYQSSIFDVGCSICVMIANMNVDQSLSSASSSSSSTNTTSNLESASYINYLHYGPVSFLVASIKWFIKYIACC